MKQIDETAITVQANAPKTGVIDQTREIRDRIFKYRIPLNFVKNYPALRKKKASMSGSLIMWSKDDQDLDVIPAKDVETYMHKYGWVIIESIERHGDEAFAFVSFAD